MLEAAVPLDTKTSVPLNIPADGIDEVGTAHVAADPKRSVLNQCCRTCYLRNLLVADESVFHNLGSVNPTLTMMASRVLALEFLALAASQREFP